MEKSALVFGVPVYNEEGNVARLLDNLGEFARSQKRVCRFLICNDGSSDRTREVILNHPGTTEGNTILIDQPRNLGVARAFERIYDETLKLGKPWSEGILVTMEGDNTSDLGILPELLGQIENGSCDVSLASCYAKGGKILNTDLHRVFLSRCANLFVRVAFAYFGIWHINTFSSFYRAVRIPFLRKVHAHYGAAFVSSEGFECMVETLARFAAQGARIGEAPMVLNGSVRSGVTKLRIRKTIWGYLRLVANLYAPRAVVARLLRSR